MYSRHSAQFDRLVDACMPPEQVAILRDIFTNPKISLEHQGPVVLSGSLVSSNQAARWAVAQHNWDYNPDKENYSFTYPSNGGGMAIAVCKEATDYRGNGTTGNTDIIIYLPVTPGDDPNVVAGDVIGFFETSDGIFVSWGYGDDQVGTVRQDINGRETTLQLKYDGTIGLGGWGVMDGSANSKINGGSALDIATSGQFLRQWSSSGDNKTTGGAATDSVTVATHGSGTSGSSGAHTHSTDSQGAHTHSTDSQGAHTHTAAAVEVAINDAHSHSVSTDNFEAYAGGTSLSGVTAVGGIDGALSAELHTHSTDSQGAHTHTAASAGAHTHTAASGGAHTHTTPSLSHGAVSVDIIPPFIYVAFLERLNNSRTGLGL